MIPWFSVPAINLGLFFVEVSTLLAIAGTLVAMGLGRRRAVRAGLSARRTVDGFGVMVLCALLLGHLLDVLLYRSASLQAGWQVLLPWNGGFCSLGAFLGGGLGVLLRFRGKGWRLRWDYLDALVPACLAGLAVLRVGCFIDHHHAGSLTGFVGAVGYPGGARHDLGLYEALALFALLGALKGWERARPRTGALAAAGTWGYCLVRFVLEFFRGDDIELLGRHSDPRYAGLTLVQYAALFVVLAGLAFVVSRSVKRGAPLLQRQGPPDRDDGGQR